MNNSLGRKYIFLNILEEKNNGKIKSINEYSYDFNHLASTEKGSSGSPIFLEGSLLVLGIYKQAKTNKKENYGNFIGPIINSLKNDLPLIEKDTNESKYKIEFGDTRGYGKSLNKKGGFYYIGQFKGLNIDGKGVIYLINNKKL